MCLAGSPPPSGGAWCAMRGDVNPFVQVDLRKKHIVSGVITQGRKVSDFYQWVTSYEVRYSLDGATWTAARNAEDDSFSALKM